MSQGDFTGAVLAGGRGLRLGGADKGLQQLAGRPLVAHVLERLLPQVGAVLISANRHQGAYEALGHRVLADETRDFAGPLAGMLAALAACRTPWLLCVPCDAPRLPLDLAQRLHATAVRDGAAGALACTRGADGVPQLQPTFMLLHQRLEPLLREALARGERSAHRFAAAHGLVPVHFDDEAAFANLNTPEDFAAMEPACSG